MKRLLLLTCILCFVFNANAQSWIKPGSVWHYDYWNLGMGGFFKYKYQSDTLIKNHLCQKIVQSEYTFFPQQNGTFLGGGPYNLHNYYTFSSGDSVFYLQDSSFVLLYNFAANIGDSWVLCSDTIGKCAPTISHVVNKGTIQINNKSLRWIEIKTNSGGKYFHIGKAIEGIGMASIDTLIHSGVGKNLFPQEVACDTNLFIEYNFYNFKCFTDSLNAFFYNPTNNECEYLLNHNGFVELKNTPKIQIFPNPTTEFLSILNSENFVLSNSLLKIYNLQGKLVKEVKITSNQSQVDIDIHELSIGMYFGKLINEVGESISFKFIKQ